MKTFGGPGELPIEMIAAWQRAVMIGGPYLDLIPYVCEPKSSLLDFVEARSFVTQKPIRRLSQMLCQKRNS